ncbi:MAG: crossover junction endodeoxyribonuclease RuvC, partial [Saprospiraceae bacterium]
MPIVLDANVLNLKEEIDQQSKLREIFLRIQEIIEAYSTGIMAVEAPFYAKNPQSMLKLGRAQGVAIAAAMVMGLDIQEFSPKKIKKSITGNGNASKEQVNLMIQSTLKYQFQTKYLDASDALATA